MAEEKAKVEVKIGKVFGADLGADSFGILVDATKETVDGVKKITAARYLLNVPYPDMAEVPEEARLAYFRAGIKSVIGNRKAAIFRASNDYGTDEDATAFVEKYSTVEGIVSALARERAEKVEKLDDAGTLAIKMLVNAQLKKLPEGTEITKELRAAAKKKALEWKAENHKNWTTFLKRAEAAVGSELAD